MGTRAPAPAEHWVGTWTAAPQLTEPSNLPPAPLSNAVLRQVVHVSLGGRRIRVRFSNEFGDGPLGITRAHVAVCSTTPVNGTIDPATDTSLSFAGSAATTMAQGTAVWSDPLDFPLAPLGNLSITVSFGGVPSHVTGHPGSRTTSYELARGGDVSAPTLTAAQTTDHWYVVSGVDVAAAAAARGVVILGDSISDGRGSTTNGNDRWPDDLARRLLGNRPTSQVAIMNQGIGGNSVTTGGLGPTASARFNRDVLGASGVTWIVVFEGVNDIGKDVSAPALTSAFASLIERAHGRHLRVYGATITPFATHAYFTTAHESTRQAVNAYVRSGAFDAVIDLDAAVRDPSNPSRLQAIYDTGDGLHLKPAGYQKLADAVDLRLFDN